MAVAPRLVVLRALGVGDLLTAVPALRALAAAYPRHERVLAAPAALAPLAALVDLPSGDPAVHRVAPVGELEPLPPEQEGAAAAVNLHGRGPHSHRVLLASGARRVIWFEHPEVPESKGSPRWRPREHEVTRWCRLLAESGVPSDPSRLDLRQPAGPPPPSAVGATLIHPGAASAARRWPLQRFAEVARAEAAAGRPVAITGSRRELPLAKSIARAAGLDGDAVLAGRTDLSELARAVGVAGRVLCGDTGVAHLATALGTPSVVLFGPTDPAEWGPPSERLRHRVLWKGRHGDPHAACPDDGLLRIGVEEVLAALSELDRPTAAARAA